MLNVKTFGIFAILLFNNISTAFVIMSSFHVDVYFRGEDSLWVACATYHSENYMLFKKITSSHASECFCCIVSNAV